MHVEAHLPALPLPAISEGSLLRAGLLHVHRGALSARELFAEKTQKVHVVKDFRGSCSAPSSMSGRDLKEDRSVRVRLSRRLYPLERCQSALPQAANGFSNKSLSRASSKWRQTLLNAENATFLEALAGKTPSIILTLSLHSERTEDFCF
jgi:hypothetical protein